MSDVLQVGVTAISVGSFYALTALAIGLLFGVLGLVNFAHGDFITVGAYALIVPSAAATASLYIGAMNPFMVVILVSAAVVAVSLLSELLVFRHLRASSPATLMIASFAISFVIQNLLIIVYGSRPKGVNMWNELNTAVEIVPGVQVALVHLLVILVTFFLLIILSLFLNKSSIGLQMRAASEDFRMATMLGIRANVVISAAFSIAGVLVAAVSIISTVQTGVLEYRMGVPLMLFAFIATVVGGMGSLMGAVLGGYLVGIISVLLQAYLPEEYRPFRDTFVFVLVILILIWRPQGMFVSTLQKERI